MEILGRAIAPGVACGVVVRNRADLPREEAAGAILVAERAVPDDVPRILACAGTITGIAPPLSHVALLSRELGKPSIGLPRLDLVPEGAIVIVDGTRGAVVIQGEEVRRLHEALAAFARAPDDASLLRVVDASKSVPRETVALLIEGVRSEAARALLLTTFPGLVRVRPSPERGREHAVPPPRAGERLVVPFGPGLTREEAGGKAAGLSRVIGACRVPAGFVVTTAAYRLHIAGGIEEKLRLAAEEPGDAEASRRARAAILSAAIPDEVRHAIDAYRLPADRLAVRSSATIEDGPLGSLAGLFDSSLGVRPQGLVDRVRRTWASLWNERAVAFLRAAGRSPDEASQAVLIQEVVPTRVSGALATGDDRLVVNAAWGLGEAIAQGEVAGDLFTLRTSTGELLSSEIVPAATWIVLDPDQPGTVERPLPAELRGRPSVTEREMETLAAVARTLGPGRVVEFGFDDSGTLVVFQVRRIVPRRGE